ncbi:MAG: ABC transporter permease [Lysobacterales bacterium 13-68-4]|jgi:sodium transport system permease protein|nr:MAG: ABC transporter permease [Xanthomonadales bacterium 15-68-25]OZB67680.1 MAG: ABC transporter permease [Xanthomonadales bacterium 14-68-21]OZB73070.1 MAG: ABC transporter permease [Xanthomonadales bacterium 13-68-4]
MNAPMTPVRRARAILTVFLKEVRENLRDRRTLTSAFLTGPLLTPLMFVMLINFSINRELDKAEQPLKVPVIGAQYAPNLINALREGGVVPQPPVADPEQAVRDQQIDLALRIRSSYPEAWRKGEPVQVELIYDSSQRDSRTPVDRVTDLIEHYAQMQGAMRLVARGLSPATAVPVVVAKRDQATAQSRAVLLFNILPYLFVLTLFIGGMYLAIDLTAGERERQSLEPLFANPVPRWKIFLGKLAAICAFSSASLVICLVGFSVVGRFVPTEKLGMELHMGPSFALHVLLLQAPMIVLLASLQSLVAAFAKSYREAQTYVSLLMMLPILPSVVLMVMPIKPQDWMYSVPLLGQHLGILDLVRGSGVSPLHLALCLGGSAIAAVIAAGITMQLYRSERLAISG